MSFDVFRNAPIIGISWFTRIVLLFMFLTMTESSFSQELPKIGQVWTGSKAEGGIFLPPPVGLTDKIVFSVNEVEFRGGVSKENKIVAISTTDSHFKINGKAYIGTRLGEFINKDEVKLVSGWGHYLPIDEEWFAGFDYKTVSDSSKVLFVFKYKFTY